MMPKPSPATTPEAAYLDNANGLGEHNADLWAMSYGFKDAAEMKAEGERMEHEHVAEMSKTGAQDE